MHYTAVDKCRRRILYTYTIVNFPESIVKRVRHQIVRKYFQFFNFSQEINNLTMFNQTVKLMGRQLMQKSVRFGSHGGVPGEVKINYTFRRYVILT